MRPQVGKARFKKEDAANSNVSMFFRQLVSAGQAILAKVALQQPQELVVDHPDGGIV